jgi:hypothetical protein
MIPTPATGFAQRPVITNEPDPFARIDRGFEIAHLLVAVAHSGQQRAKAGMPSNVSAMAVVSCGSNGRGGMGAVDATGHSS